LSREKKTGGVLFGASSTGTKGRETRREEGEGRGLSGEESRRRERGGGRAGGTEEGRGETREAVVRWIV